MIDRAVLAGAGLGVGLLLILQQVVADTPNWIVLLVAVILVVLGLVAWSDLRDERMHDPHARRHR